MIEANSNTNHQDNTNEIQSNITQRSNLWKFMKKLNNEKAKCNICSRILSRQNGATSGLRKHLSHIHKIEPFSTSLAHNQLKSYQLSTEEKKKLDSLIIKCIVQDGRGFDDMRRPGILEVFNRLSPCKKNKRMLCHFY